MIAAIYLVALLCASVMLGAFAALLTWALSWSPRRWLRRALRQWLLKKKRKPRRLIVRFWRSRDGVYHLKMPQRYSVAPTQPFDMERLQDWSTK